MEYSFGILFSASETHNLIEQLSKMTMQKLIQNPEGLNDSGSSDFMKKRNPQSKNTKKSFLLRDLTAKQASDEYRIFFRLPKAEQIDGTIKGNSSLIIL